MLISLGPQARKRGVERKHTEVDFLEGPGLSTLYRVGLCDHLDLGARIDDLLRG